MRFRLCCTQILISMSPEPNFPALPVRQRGTLEIIDTAMKLYRRYFGVLMGWSALTALLFVVSTPVTCGAGALLVFPLVSGAGCCAMAAAVRGQRITFGQVWEFTKPRYGALLLIAFLGALLLGAVSGAMSMISVFISLAGTMFFSAINAPTEVTLVFTIIGTIIGSVISSILSVLAYAWLGLVPIIACLEDDKRSSAALGRAWELMKGHWKRVLGLATLLSIAIIAVMGIVGGSIALFGSGIGAFVDDPSDTAIWGVVLTFGGFFGLFLLFWNPIQTMILAVLYLDLRVRNEALDLEWNSYASAPPVQANAPEISAVEFAGNAATNATPTEWTPASTSGYAPGSSAPAIAATATPTPAVPVTTGATPATMSGAPVTTVGVPANAADASVTTAQVPLAQVTSSFSGAPAAPLTPSSAPITPSNEPITPQEAFDFSSSFGAEPTNYSSFSPDAEDKRNKNEGS